MKIITEEILRLDIENRLKNILFYKNCNENTLEWGMNYIMFSSSKRVRPLLLLEANLAFSGINHDAYLLASAVELIHTYSLVHDDLPCMDDDELRRGIKTLHVIRDEAYALLVGDALLTRCFEILAQYKEIQKLSQVLEMVHLKAGVQGMVRGQFLDMSGEGKNLGIEQINRINLLKTAALLQLPMMLGALNGGAEDHEIRQIEKLGEVFGQMFQLQDDILDITGDRQILGKNTGSDEKNMKSSVPLILGLEESRARLNQHREKALKLVEILPSNQDFFYRFIDFLVNRAK